MNNLAAPSPCLPIPPPPDGVRSEAFSGDGVMTSSSWSNDSGEEERGLERQQKRAVVLGPISCGPAPKPIPSRGCMKQAQKESLRVHEVCAATIVVCLTQRRGQQR